MKKVITYGTFDLLHYGHIKLLLNAKKLGDHLTVAISSDRFNIEKGKKCILPLEERMELVKSLNFVDDVIVEDTWDQKETDIKDRSIDIFTIGDDWKGKFDHLNCKVIYTPRTSFISTTLLKKQYFENNSSKKK